MKQTLNDLNAYLFEELDRLSNDDMDESAIEAESMRAEAIVKTSKAIIDNSALQLSAKKYFDGQGTEYSIPTLGQIGE